MFILIHVFIRDVGEERGQPLSNDELLDVALDFKWFFAVLSVGFAIILIAICLPDRNRHANEQRPHVD